MYSLSKNLIGHQSDVRGLSASNDAVVSCSRDGTVRWWNLESQLPETVFQSSTSSFVNTVEFVDQDPPLLASAGKDNIVFVNSVADRDCDMGQFNLVGHQNNVCSLHYKSHLLISSSWDATARVWDTTNMQQKYVLQHPASVLDSKVVGPDLFLTCCADKLIRLWRGDKVTQTYTGHTDVVRKLAVISGDVFASCSNDASIKIWNFDGSCITTLNGHESFIYDLTLLPNELLVSCGEDRSVRIWKDFTLSQTITLPCISNWCLTHVDNDIVVGGSDGYIRVFTADADRVASEQELHEFSEAVKNSTIAEQSLDINKTDVPGYERLSQPGNEGQTVMVKSPAGVIEAHQWSNSSWNKIGDVVSSAGSGGKQAFNGKEYDYVFDVDIEDGKPALKLPYNVGDNVYVAAQKFLADNELPSSYTDEVVRFIQKNTEGFKLDEKGAESKPEPAAAAAANLSIIPVTTPIYFEDVNAAQIGKGIDKFNQSSATKVAMFETWISSSDACEYILTTVKTVFDGGSQLLALDLLRALIAKVNLADVLKHETMPQVVFEIITQSLASNDASLLMMLLRFLSNLTKNTLFMQIYLTQEAALTYSEFFEQHVQLLVGKFVAVDANHKHYNNFLVSLATFVLDCSVLQTTKGITSAALAPLVAQTYNSEEAAYRILISYGNLKHAGVAVPQPPWADQYTAPRFAALAQDLRQL